jgi:hypothetical protein
MNSEVEYKQILHAVSEWPWEDRVALAQDVLATLKAPKAGVRTKDTLSRALGLGRGDNPPPTDDEVRRWIDEHRTSKYGS